MSEALVQAEYKFTILDSVGGFLREAGATFLLVVEEDSIPGLLALIETHARQREQVVNFMPVEAAAAGALITSPIKAPVGGAIVFTLDVDQFHRF